MCCNNEASDSARFITTVGTGADHRVSMCACHTGCAFYLVIVAAPVEIVSWRKVAQAVKEKKMTHSNIKFKKNGPTLKSSQKSDHFPFFSSIRYIDIILVENEKWSDF